MLGSVIISTNRWQGQRSAGNTMMDKLIIRSSVTLFSFIIAIFYFWFNFYFWWQRKRSEGGSGWHAAKVPGWRRATLVMSLGAWQRTPEHSSSGANSRLYLSSQNSIFSFNPEASESGRLQKPIFRQIPIESLLWSVKPATEYKRQDNVLFWEKRKPSGIRGGASFTTQERGKNPRMILQRKEVTLIRMQYGTLKKKQFRRQNPTFKSGIFRQRERQKKKIFTSTRMKQKNNLACR